MACTREVATWAMQGARSTMRFEDIWCTMPLPEVREAGELCGEIGLRANMGWHVDVEEEHLTKKKTRVVPGPLAYYCSGRPTPDVAGV